MIDQIRDGKPMKVVLGDCLNDIFLKTIMREYSLLNILIPELSPYCILSSHRENRDNVKKLRATINELVQERKDGKN